MMNIREYFYSADGTEEVDLWNALENDEDFDLEAWATAHNVDLEAVDARTGEKFITLWTWDMCGD